MKVALVKNLSRGVHRLFRRIQGRSAGADVDPWAADGSGVLHTHRHGPLTLSHRQDSPVSMVDERLLGLLENAENPQGIGVTVLKRGCRRSVFSLALGGEAVVIKSFPLDRTRKRLRWKQYAAAEWSNNHRARERGIPTPECYAMFVTRRCGLVSNCGVVMKHLRDWQKLPSRAEDAHGELRRAIPVLVELYHAGVNHVDISPENILIDPTTGNHAIIDWQYCTFHEPRNDLQLVLQAAHFLERAGMLVGSHEWVDWIATLHRASETERSLEALRDTIGKVQPLKIRIPDRMALEPRNASDAVAILRAA